MKNLKKSLERFKDLDNLLKVLKYVLDNSVGLGVNLPTLTQFYLEHLLHQHDYSQKDFMRAYHRLYRFFRTLRNHGYIEVKRIDGLVWVKAHSKTVDLIFCTCKTQTQRGSRKIMETRKRLNEYKFIARNMISNKHVLNPNDYNYLYDLFLSYIDETDRKVLVFKSPDSRIVVKPYSHRFQRRYLRSLEEKLKAIFDNASKKFQTGAFLTLTMDPKSYSNIFEGIRARSRAWNRFMSFMRKRFGFRPPYVAVLEFQDSGNPHLHVVIFGVSRIMDHYELTRYLKGHGFGQIHYEYKIVNRHGNWVWESGGPGSSRGVKEYLEKYLKKAFGFTSSESLDSYKVSLYWASDSRFFTYSRSLIEAVKLAREYGWVFIGSYDVFDSPDWLYPYVEEQVAELFPELGPPSLAWNLL